jgi:hypothetical protein
MPPAARRAATAPYRFIDADLLDASTLGSVVSGDNVVEAAARSAEPAAGRNARE